MYTFQTPKGGAGTDQLYGIQESISSHLEGMFLQDAKRSILEHGVGRTTSTAGGIDSKIQLHAQRRECDAAITFHAGKSIELAMQLIYAYGTDRIMGREYPGVPERTIAKDIRKGHDLSRVYHRLLSAMTDRDMKNAFENGYQKALNRGIVDVLIDGEFSFSEFESIEDIPFREQAIRFIADGMEVTSDHSEAGDLIFPRTKKSEFKKIPLDTFAQFLAKADAAYYESDIPDEQGNKSGRNMRWADYSARDHEYGRDYVVAGISFFARLTKELVLLANQQWIWHEDLARRWWGRRKYNISRLLEAHVEQNFRSEVEFPEMIPPEEAMNSYRSVHVIPADKVKQGYHRFRTKRPIQTKS